MRSDFYANLKLRDKLLFSGKLMLNYVRVLNYYIIFLGTYSSHKMQTDIYIYIIMQPRIECLNFTIFPFNDKFFDKFVVLPSSKK